MIKFEEGDRRAASPRRRPPERLREFRPQERVRAAEEAARECGARAARGAGGGGGQGEGGGRRRAGDRASGSPRPAPLGDPVPGGGPCGRSHSHEGTQARRARVDEASGAQRIAPTPIGGAETPTVAFGAGAADAMAAFEAKAAKRVAPSSRTPREKGGERVPDGDVSARSAARASPVDAREHSWWTFDSRFVLEDFFVAFSGRRIAGPLAGDRLSSQVCYCFPLTLSHPLRSKSAPSRPP